MADNFLEIQNLEEFEFLVDKPNVFHCTGLSLGSKDEFAEEYIQNLLRLNDFFQPQYLSDHLSWSSFQGRHSHDLLPLPYNLETVHVVSDNLKCLMDKFGKQFLVENVSTYLSLEATTMSEQDFILEVVDKSGCGILLDVNNVYVNSINHVFDPFHYLDVISSDCIKFVHIAGHRPIDGYLLDDHGDFVSAPVAELFSHLVNDKGSLPFCLEWDNNIPSFYEYMNELQRVSDIGARVGEVNV